MASRCSQVSVSRAESEVGRNPPRSVRCKRTKKSPVAVRHLYPNLGTDGAIRCAGLRASSALRTQIIFSSTFPGIHGYRWRVDWFLIEPKGSLGQPSLSPSEVLPLAPTADGVSGSWDLRTARTIRPITGWSNTAAIPPGIPTGIPMTSSSTFQTRMPSFRLAHSQRESILLTHKSRTRLVMGSTRICSWKGRHETHPQADFGPSR
jgi:hypothetical protein